MQRFDSLQEEYVASVPFRVDVRKMYRVEEFPVDWRGGDTRPALHLLREVQSDQ